MCLDPFQTGFWPGYDTETVVGALVDYLRRGLAMESAFLLVLLGLSVVFNTINCGILLDCLLDLGLGVIVLQAVCSFLPDRS